MIEMTFLKEVMLIKKANQKIVRFVTVGIFQIKTLRFNQMSAMDVMIINDVYEPQQYCYFKH